jgi:PIN domain nuclease of toxin-antitoxin system
VRLLLDTHVVIWWLERSARLRSEVGSAINDPANEVYVSAVCAIEMSLKRAQGRLRTPDDLELQMERSAFTALPVTVAHGVALGSLPPLHGDPFDRLLVVQARAEGLTLVTADRAMSRYDVPILAA